MAVVIHNHSHTWVNRLCRRLSKRWPCTSADLTGSFTADRIAHVAFLSVTPRVINRAKLQALVYDILPSTTAVFSYAIGSRKLSANEQFFVGAQTVVSLLQTTQIKQDVSFITTNKVYTITNKTTIVWIETELFFSFFFNRGGCVSCLRACLGDRLLLQSY